MSERELLAILGAIVYAGADNYQSGAGYSPRQAVEIAEQILWQAREHVDERDTMRAE